MLKRFPGRGQLHINQMVTASHSYPTLPHPTLLTRLGCRASCQEPGRKTRSAEEGAPKKASHGYPTLPQSESTPKKASFFSDVETFSRTRQLHDINHLVTGSHYPANPGYRAGASRQDPGKKKRSLEEKSPSDKASFFPDVETFSRTRQLYMNRLVTGLHACPTLPLQTLQTPAHYPHPTLPYPDVHRNRKARAPCRRRQTTRTASCNGLDGLWVALYLRPLASASHDPFRLWSRGPRTWAHMEHSWYPWAVIGLRHQR